MFQILFASLDRGHTHRIAGDSLSPPYASPSVDNSPRLSPREGAPLHVEDGYRVEPWATGLNRPRRIAVAPNGDVFVAESFVGRISLLRPEKGGVRRHVFATNRLQPYGIAFFPPGAKPEWIYIADTDGVYRWPYRSGELHLRGRGRKLMSLPGAGYNQHWTRNILFGGKAKRMYITVGSATNASPEASPRATILEANTDGSGRHVFASGLRNPVGLAWQPGTNVLWTAANERDRLGDEVPPDFATSVLRGGFYGWPYYYIGAHHDPRLPLKPGLAAKSIVPDVLL